MRSWCAKIGLIASLASLGGMAATVRAQCPSCGPAGMASHGAQSQQPCDPMSATVLPNDGSPNAFADCQPSCCWHDPVLWFGAEYVAGFTRRGPLSVPLATTSTNPNPSTETGAIGQSATEVLFGLDGLDLRHPQGMRLTVGVSPTRDWLVPLEVVYTSIDQRNALFSETSNTAGNPLLARPVFSTQPGLSGEVSFRSSSPGLLAGGINVDSSLQLWGVQAVGLVHTGLQWGDDCHGCAIDFPIGFRYLNLNEVIGVTSTAKSISANSLVNFLGSRFGRGSETIVTDMFKGTNEFRGGEFGIRLESRLDRLTLLLEPRISIGATQQAAEIGGVSNLILASGAHKTTAGGILAVASNSGNQSREQFTYLPEATASLAWQCFPWMRIQAGYNITYWPNVQRPGNEINRSVDVRQVPTSPFFNASATSTSPSFLFKDSTFLIQDVSAGIVFSY